MNTFLSSFASFVLLLTLLLTPLTYAHTSTIALNSGARSTVQSIRQDTRDQFKTKLAQIKDTRKQTLVSRIDSRIAEINIRRTKEMTMSLTKLSAILDRVVAKSATITPADSEDHLSTARAKIATAQAAVTTQQAKQYVISLTTDDALGTVVAATMKTFSTDLKTTHQTVVDAKQAVIEAIKALELDQSDTSPTLTGEAK